jgi:hypothetical protein
MKRSDMCTEIKRVPPGQVAGSGNEVKEKEEKRKEIRIFSPKEDKDNIRYQQINLSHSHAWCPPM